MDFTALDRAVLGEMALELIMSELSVFVLAIRIISFSVVVRICISIIGYGGRHRKDTVFKHVTNIKRAWDIFWQGYFFYESLF